MNRRRLFKTFIGSVIGSSYLLNMQEPAVSVSYNLSSIPDADPSNVNSILIEINNLTIKPRYINSTEASDIVFEVEIEGYEKKLQKVQTELNQKKNLSDLKNINPNFGNIVIDDINESGSSIIGTTKIEIQNDSISKEYIRNFTISDVNVADTLTTSATLNDQSIKITVFEDLNATGSYDNTESVYIDTGNNTYDLDNINGGAGNKYKFTADLETSNINKTPILNSVELGDVLSLNTESDWNNIGSESGVVHENTMNTDQNDATTVKKGYSLTNPLFENNLIGYWALQEDQGSVAYDFSSNGNNGSINGPTINATGLLGTSSYEFNSSSSENVIISDDPEYGGLNEITISAWVNSDNLDGNYRWVIRKSADSNECAGSPFFFGQNTSNELTLAINDNGYQSGYSLDSSYTDSWVHIAATYDGTYRRFYLDGDQKQRDNFSQGTVNSTGGNLYIGGQPCGQYFDGKISDVRIYNTRLTEAEINQLYQTVQNPSTIESNEYQL